MSTPKELFYFSHDFPRLRQATDQTGYRAFFSRAKPGQLRGEATAAYLYSTTAAAEIARQLPAAKLIVLLRNPIEQVQSLHRQLLFNGDEDQSDFASAWRLQEERGVGRRLPPRCRTPAFLQYREVGRLGSQLARLYEHIPRERVLVLWLDDLITDPRALYLRTLAFLGLPDDGRRDFTPANSARQFRHPMLGRLLGQRPRWLQGGIDRTKRRLGPTRLARLESLVAKPAAQAVIPTELERELRDEFQPEIERLADLTGRDLSDWLTRPLPCA